MSVARGQSSSSQHAGGLAIQDCSGSVSDPAFGVGVALVVEAPGRLPQVPWAGLAVGVLLIFMAGRLLAGRSLYGSLGNRLANRMGGTACRGWTWGHAAFGLA
ncbi:MAG TPA: hypothetical protein VKK19_03015, partial [Candidatus Dormibacteraeota bacterium]|nr:hypothetical protein [Candidatus Dormibacteraeota bacterium]